MNSEEFLRLVHDLEQVGEVLDEKIKAYEDEKKQKITNS